MMRIGTNHFVSRETAVRYYKTTRRDILEKIRAGEIKIGRPTEKPGQRVLIIDGGLRYAIEE